MKTRIKPRLQWPVQIITLLIYLTADVIGSNDIWPMERPNGMPSIQSLEVMCGKDHMDVHLTFSQPFEGIVSSKGQHGDPRCIYVPPSSGQNFFSFRIAYSRCGTKPDLNGQFYENTVVIQYDKDLLEVWDEAKRLRCEWFNDYEKTASKPPMVIADLDVIQLDFKGDNVDCWMEIQHGKGPWAPTVSGIVPLGSTLTLVVAINDYRGEFDMRVKSCSASDGAEHVIQLSDENGCVLRPKMISRFLKARASDERATVITYAFFHAFKFPDALSVHIKCKVEICRHGCLDHCQATEASSVHKSDVNVYNAQDRKDIRQTEPHFAAGLDTVEAHFKENVMLEYDDITQHGDDMIFMDQHSASVDENNLVNSQQALRSGPEHNSFPHGPRKLDPNADVVRPKEPTKTPYQSPSDPLPTPRKQRKRRAMVVSDRQTRSADVGVSSLYEVISEADLAFSPDSKSESVAIFQGRISEEVVYGICLPVPGFSALFIVVIVSAIASASFAGALLYRYQSQKEQMLTQKNPRGASLPQQRNHKSNMPNTHAPDNVNSSVTNCNQIRLVKIPECSAQPAINTVRKKICHQNESPTENPAHTASTS